MSSQIDVHPQELASGVFELRYDCVRDQYTRPLLRSGALPMANFASVAEKSGDVHRKVEPGWRAFLTSDGIGSLMYTINHPGAIVQNAEMRMNGVATFRQGKVGATLTCGNKNAEIPLDNEPFLAEQQGEKQWAANREPLVETMRVREVGEADQTVVTIHFDDQTPNAGLDHDLDDAQVFRTPLDQPNGENLVIRVEFAQEPVIKVTDLEREQGKFELHYDSAFDQYTRPSDLTAHPEPIPDYATLAARRGGIHRKVEPNWRSFITSDGPGTLSYIIVHAGARVKSAEARLAGVTTFRQGEIGLQLKCGNKLATVPLTNDKFLAQQQGDRIWGLNRESEVETVRVDQMGDADKTVLTVQFGDKTPNANLDHDLDDAQLFRNPLDKPRPDNLVICIEFEKSVDGPPAVVEQMIIQPPTMNGGEVDAGKKKSSSTQYFDRNDKKDADPIIEVTDVERAVGHFELRYDSVRDAYTRPFDPHIGQPIGNYGTLAAQRGGVFRKVEPEWRAFLTSNMAGALRYTIVHPGASVKSAEAQLNGIATFRQGAIGVQLKCGDKSDTIPLANKPFLAEQQGDRVWGLNREPVVERLRVDEVGDADRTTVVIFFNDMTENEQLDHDLDDAQVFRTPLDKPDPANLVIHIEFVEPLQMPEPENIEKHGKPTPEVQQTADELGNLLQEAQQKQTAAAAADKQWHQGEEALDKILTKISHMTIVERYAIVTIIRNKFGLDPASALRHKFGSNYERKIIYINFDKSGQQLQPKQLQKRPAVEEEEQPPPTSASSEEEEELNAVADALGVELAKGTTNGGANRNELKQLLTRLSLLSPINRYRITKLVHVKYGIVLSDALKVRFSDFEQLIELLLIKQLAHITSVYEEQVITTKKQTGQLAAATAGADYMPISSLSVSPAELTGARCFLLKYDCARDQYTRPFNLTGQRIYNSYQSLLHSARDVRRVTTDQARGAADEDAYAYIGSGGNAGELIWRIEHPGARVDRVQVLISGMATLDDDAKIGVDLRCGEEESERRPDAIPYNAQRIDIMEMENVGPANFTEVKVTFFRESGTGKNGSTKPSQLFRAVFGDAATADDFVIRIEYATPKSGESDNFNERKEALAQELNQRLRDAKSTNNDFGTQQIVQILTTISTLTLTERNELLTLTKHKYGIDVEKEFYAILPKESGTELVDHLFKKTEEPMEEPQPPAVAADVPPPSPPEDLERQKFDEVPIQPPSLPQPQTMTKEGNGSMVTNGEHLPAPGAPAMTAPTTKVLDLDQAAELIYKAIGRGVGHHGVAGGGLMKMFKKAPKSDTEQILTILISSNANTRRLIAQAYRNRYQHEDLVETIRKELADDGPKALMLALLYGMDTYDAISLHNAMKGLGTDEHVLTEILVTRSNDQIRAIRKAYTELYNKQLETDIGGDTSGTYRRLLSNLCAANRDESGTVSSEKAKQDAKALFGAGEKRLGTDEATFLALLTRDNQLQLNALFYEYEQLTGHPMEKALASEFSSDTLDAFNAIVQFARNPARFFAQRLNAAIKAHNETDLIRLVVTRAESGEMPAVGAEFNQLYGHSLPALIVSESKVATKQALATLAKAYGAVNGMPPMS